MRNRIERLRIWLLAGTGLLVAVLAVFIGSARYLKGHFLARLPARLGVDIKSETNGFTYSQSIQGRTVYTIHASKEVEHSNGTITLHDVSMILYGRTGDRADRVEGKEFEYDQNAGVLRAVGLVHMDLGAAGSGVQNGRPAKDIESEPKLLHATTSGLVYLEKLGVAATSEAIDFDTGQMKGHAVGADYNTDSGVLLLHSAVRMDGVANGRAVSVRSATAKLDDRGQRAVLTEAQYVSGEQTMSAHNAVLHSRPDNTLERVEAEGDVVLGQQGATVSAARADVAVGPKNNPETAVLTGGVQYADSTPVRQARGVSAEARIRFDANGAPEDGLFTGKVEMIERTRTVDDAKQPWVVRTIVGDSVHTTMSAVAKGRSELRTVEAKGGARVTVIDNGQGAGPAGQGMGRGTTELAGDDVKADLVPGGGAGAVRLDMVTAQGHTVVRQVAPDGLEQTSSGDSLVAQFRPAVTGAGSGPGALGGGLQTGAVELASAVQQGHVVVTRTAEGSGGSGKQTERATAPRAVYKGDTDRVDLTGGVQLSDGDSVLLAQAVQFERGSGDAEAEGNVKVSYTEAQQGAVQQGSGQQAAGSDPVHVLADKAEMVRASGMATFSGRPARLWQGGSQVQAPVLEIAREQRQLTAHGGAAGQVVTILTSEKASGTADSGRPGQPGRAGGQPQTVRVTSSMLVYDDGAQSATFTGAVRTVAGDDVIRSREAVAFLAAAGAGQPASGVGAAGPVSLEGRLDRVIATGEVVVDQPGRHATGQRLSYTASDGTVVLTGGPNAPPKVTDVAQGTTISAVAFRFHAADEMAEALSSVPEGSFSQQVRTETPVRR